MQSTQTSSPNEQRADLMMCGDLVWCASRCSLLPGCHFADCPVQFLASAPADIVQSRLLLVRAALSLLPFLIFKFLQISLSLAQPSSVICASVLRSVCLLHLIASVCTCSARWPPVGWTHWPHWRAGVMAERPNSWSKLVKHSEKKHPEKF